MVTYPSSFRRFRCMVSEKSSSEIFSHFPFFSKSMHPLITILLWEMPNDDRNMLTKFQLNPSYRLRAMAKTSSDFVTIQQQQLEGADLNVKTIACSSDPARGNLHQEKQSKSSAKPHAIKGSKHAAAESEHATAKSFTAAIQLRGM